MPSTEIVAPRTLLNTLLAMAIAVAAILALAFITEQLDDSIKDPETVQEVTGLGTLGTIAQLKGQRGRSEIYRLVSLLHPRSSVAEAYRALRSNVEFASVDAPVRSLLVTSSAPQRGQDHDGLQPGGRVRPGRSARPARRRRPPPARRPRHVRRPQHDRADDAPPGTRRGRSQSWPRRPRSPTCGSSPPAPCRPTRPSCWGRCGCAPCWQRLLEQADLVVFDSPPMRLARGRRGAQRARRRDAGRRGRAP